MASIVKRVLNADGITSFTTLNVGYAADNVNDLMPTKFELGLFAVSPGAAGVYYYQHNVTKYLGSISSGISDTVSEAEYVHQQCPNALLILAGYSQGAMVMHQAELQLAAANDVGVLGQIAGTLLLGDGDRVPDTAAREFGTSASGSEGVRTWLAVNSDEDVVAPGATANICNAGDIVCDFSAKTVLAGAKGLRIHTSYAVPNKQKKGTYSYDPALTNAAAWIAGLAADRLGGRWTAIALPLPGNASATGASTLYSAACSSTTCGAGGTYQDSSGITQGLLLSGSGASWIAAEAPIPVPATDYRSAQVLAVACPSDCFAIGDYQDLDGGSHPMLWSGSAAGWTGAEAPVPGGQPDAANYLSSIACYSASACLAAGYYFDSSGHRQGWLLTWDGSAWTPSEAPLPANAAVSTVVLDSAACASGTKCIAIGTYLDSSGQEQSLILTGMGSSWTGTEAPLPADAITNDSNAANRLTSVTCPSASTCIAVGIYTDSSSEAQPWIISGEGLSWTTADVPFPADVTNQPAVASFNLDSVSCSSVTDCVASGVYVGSINSEQALLLTGSGTSWTATDAPLPANDNGGASELVSAACQPGGRCVTVGRYFPVYNNQQSLILSGQKSSWTPTEGPMPPNASGSDASDLFSVACPPASSCVAVGTYADTSATYGLLLIGPSLGVKSQPRRPTS